LNVPGYARLDLCVGCESVRLSVVLGEVVCPDRGREQSAMFEVSDLDLSSFPAL